jgi:hypothetical protein
VECSDLYFLHFRFAKTQKDKRQTPSKTQKDKRQTPSKKQEADPFLKTGGVYHYKKW